MSPHSRPPRRIDTDIEAAVSMLRMYSRWTGETLRSRLERDRQLSVEEAIRTAREISMFL